MQLQLLGMDGCSVNVGIHKGVFRCLELQLGEPVQHAVCLLHHVELYYHHEFEMVDGITLGPG